MDADFAFDQDALVEEITDQLTDQLEEIVEEALCANLPEMVREALRDCLEEYRFRLPDGTEVIPRSQLRLMNPDGTKQLVCYGGLRVTDTRCYNRVPDGWALEVQTRISSWEIAAIYPEKEQAASALKQVSAAMEEGKAFLQLT